MQKSIDIYKKTYEPVIDRAVTMHTILIPLLMVPFM